MADQKLEQLKQKYQSVLRMIEQQQVRLAHVHMEGGKLFIQGAAPSADAKNRVWDQVKLVDPAYSDLTLDVTVDEQAQPAAGMPPAGAQPQARTHTVQSGESLSKISRQYYGDPNQYPRIFEANRDQLSDPDKIKPGQVLTIP